MITFVAPRRMPDPLTDYTATRASEYPGRMSLEFYDDWGPRTSFAPGTYVFAGLEWLESPMLDFVGGVCAQLGHRDDFRFLNDPRKTLGRHDFLAELTRRGHNDFRAVRLSADFSSLRYPVFVRSERDHNGPLSLMLNSTSEIECAVGLAVCGGYKSSDLLVVEYSDTSDHQGHFWKYGAFILGDRIFSRHLNRAPDWMVKHGRTDYDMDHAIAERDYVEKNPHEGQLAEIVGLGGAEYGRIDYTLRDGRIQAWEINLNPTIGRPRWKKPSAAIPAEVREFRNATNAIFYDRLRDALVAVDRDSSSPPVTIDRPAPMMRGMRSVRTRSRRLTKIQRALPITNPLMSVIGRRAIASYRQSAGSA